MTYDPTKTGYTLTRVFDAPIDLVWECWTKPEHFAVWFGTDAYPVTDMVVDARPGGAWGGTMHVPEVGAIAWTGFFLEVDAPHRLVLALSDEPIVDERYDTYRLTLVDLDGKTELTLSQVGGHLSPEDYQQAKAGTASFLDTMADLLATLQR